MDEIVTHLEMTAPSELRPGRPVDEVTLERIDGTPELIRQLHVSIGTPYNWPSSTRSDEAWAQWLSRPLSQYWLVKHGTASAGIADMQAQPDGDVEITTFGLLPEYVGKGLGGHALTLRPARVGGGTGGSRGRAAGLAAHLDQGPPGRDQELPEPRLPAVSRTGRPGAPDRVADHS